MSISSIRSIRMNDRTTPPLTGTEPPVRPDPWPLGIDGEKAAVGELQYRRYLAGRRREGDEVGDGPFDPSVIGVALALFQGRP